MKLTAATILREFQETIEARGGSVIEKWESDSHLIARSLLPDIQEVRIGDKHQGGVALRATPDKVWVHPYVFRLVCKNGAIMARTIQTRQLAVMDSLNTQDALAKIREAIEECSVPEAFEASVDHLRSSTDRGADFAISMMAVLKRLPGGPDLMIRIMELFFNEKDLSQFGAINAVTAVARDTPDPESRWQLEEYAGSLALLEAPAKDSHVNRSLHAPRADLATVV